MRIAWATPFNAHSAIGSNFSAPMTEELMRRGHDVEIVRIELGKAAELPTLASAARIHGSGVPVDLLRLKDFDVVVINWGDDILHHGGALAIAARVRGVAILHDSTMESFVRSAASIYQLTPDYFTAALPPRLVSGGATARNAGRLAWFARFGSAAVVHDRRDLAHVQATCPGPVRVIPRFHGTAAQPASLSQGARFVVKSLRAAASLWHSSNSAGAYADALVPLLQETPKQAAVLEAGFQIGMLLDACGAAENDPAIGRIGAVMDELFGATIDNLPVTQ